MWTTAAPLMPLDDAITLGLAVTSVLASIFHMSKAILGRIPAKLSVFGTWSAKLKVTVYAERQDTTCRVNSNGVSRSNPGAWLVLLPDDNT
ncbi:hypothetical protein QYE76_020715 [Lolium multiflorum]|uniref:Uncharacterized protein n=1 Tax=Lolium multiflorum TaxID=4521 RepID=A0AAD8VSG7_LOLMU|nr:hypothetical protein QYE76_020715 [Lolium multiflorum]